MNERKARRAVRTHDALKAMQNACISSLQPHNLMPHDGNLRTSEAACWPTSCLASERACLCTTRLVVCGSKLQYV